MHVNLINIHVLWVKCICNIFIWNMADRVSILWYILDLNILLYISWFKIIILQWRFPGLILVAAADDPVDEKEPEKFAKVKPKGE